MIKILYKIFIALINRARGVAKTLCALNPAIWLLLLLGNNVAGAQEMVFTPVEGRQQLNEERIRNIIELKDGRIGVFTEGMLNIYDGSSFKTIHLDDLNAIPVTSYTGFHHSYIENNHLWFKCLGKLSLINISKEKSEKDPGKVLKEMGFTGVPVDLFVDKANDLWVINDTGALQCYDSGSKKNRLFLKDVALKGSPVDRVYDIAYCNKNIYLFYKSGLVRCFNRFTAKELFQKRVTGKSPDTLKEWIHTTVVGNYIYIIRAGIYEGRLLRFDTRTHEVKTLIDANEYWLNTFAADKDGGFIMSSNKGLWHFNPGSTKGTLYPKLKILGRNDITTEVSTVLFDSRGGFWAGTLNKGLYYYHPDRFRFPQYQKQLFKISGDNELQVNCFTDADDGKLLIGTNQGLFTTPLPLTSSSVMEHLLPGVYCNALVKDSRGCIWLSTPVGLYVRERDGALRLRYPKATNYVYEATDSAIYVGTENEGLLRWTKASESFECIYTGTKISHIQQFTEWRGFLAGLSSGGPFIMDLKTHKITVSTGKNDKKLPMFGRKSHRYTCIFTDSAQDLWVGTYDGLTMWDSKNKKLYRMDTQTGLINNSIKAIIEDEDHAIWVTTSRGVSHIIKNCSGANCTFSVINHYKHTGIIEHPFTERAAFLSPVSGLFFGAIDGMNNIPQSSAGIKQRYLRPTFLNLKLFGKNVAAGSADNDNILTNALNATDTLRLNYKQNFISIGYSGLNYINPSESHFRYKLEGIDDDWRVEAPPSDYGEATYTGLAPGEYVFKLEASPDGIHWVNKPKTMVVVIAPPIWKTTSAKLLYGIIGCCFIWLLYRYIVKRSALKREKQHAEAVEKAKSDFITNMSHELRTPLSLIITPLRALIQKVPDRNLKAELRRIGNNANLLLDTVNQLLEFKKIDAANEVLHPHFCGSLNFISEICDAYSEMADEKQIAFTQEIFEGDLHIHIDKQKVKRIIVNLLSNAIKFTPVGGRVTLSATFNEATEELNIAVKDTGTGIQPGELDRIFERFYQADNQDDNPIGSGIGLFMVKQYVDLHRGSITVESTPGSGTCFKVLLSGKEENTDVLHTPGHVNDKKTVLLVEDHPGFRTYISSELSSYYNIITAENGKIGLEKTLQYLPDIVISDMMMPEMDGAAFCKALRNNISISHTPVIMLTGRTSDEARFEGYESGADAYLVKPFDIKFLLLRIAKLLEMNYTRHKTFINEKDVKAGSITTNPLDKELLERALRFVDKNLSNPDYSVEKFSTDMGMDRTGLYRKLVALTGYPPINFIRSIRLKKAAELLSESNMAIADIAEAVGFNSMSYFSKCFHDSFSKTPSQYREEKISKN
ncbi:ATP-binding protein [Flavobacterium sp. RHBU_24]|uniref:hybrid sensor histidine kinase/response regulator transcription factor n=1 Tax=Flavobacterium sp. RHBU_24 TaxID=3391185 RepID=UPI0039853A8A